MYFNHAFRKTLLAKNNAGALGIYTKKTISTQTTVKSGTLYTIASSTAHGLSVGNIIIISGVTPTDYNGTWTITAVPSSTTFTIDLGSSSAGTGISVAGSFLVGSNALPAGYVGLYNSSFNPIDNTVSTVPTTPFYLIQGSYYTNDKIGSHGGYQESVKSKMINPKYISRIFWVQSKAPQNNIVKVQTNVTSSASTSAAPYANTQYRMRIDLKGSPALRFLSHNVYRTVDGQVIGTDGYFVDPILILDQWKTQINTFPLTKDLVSARLLNQTASVTPSATTTQAYITAERTGILQGDRVFCALTAQPSSASSTISGTTFTVITATAASPFTVGMTISGPGVIPGTKLVRLLSGNGGAANSTFEVNITQNVPAATIVGPAAGTLGAYFFVKSDYTTATGSGNIDLVAAADLYTPSSTAISAATISAVAGTLFVSIINTIVASGTSANGTYVNIAQSTSSTAFSNVSNAYLELTSAYVETKFGNATFTITDNYDLEPLRIFTSFTDDSGNPNQPQCFGKAVTSNGATYYAGEETQTISQAQGVGETVLRELILTGKYRQEAFGDGTNIDQFRMREIEANPGVMDMMSIANRNGLYNKLCILHNVPRFNNPTAVFDNDQYLIEIAVPSNITIDKLFVGQTTGSTAGGTITSATTGSTALLGDYILKASQNAGGAQYAEMI